MPQLPRQIQHNLNRIVKAQLPRHAHTMSLFPRFSSSLGPMRHEFGPFFNLFNDTFSELQKLSDTASRSFAPRFDVKESKDQYILEGELPGIKQKDVTIEFVDDHTLTIKGRTESYKEEGSPADADDAAAADDTSNTAKVTDANPDAADPKPQSTEVATTGARDLANPAPKHMYWVSERSVGEFARSFAFPNKVDQENVKASLKDGILSIVVPKMLRQSGGRKITIEEGPNL